jgi:hypothetical protein
MKTKKGAPSKKQKEVEPPVVKPATPTTSSSKRNAKMSQHSAKQMASVTK